MTAFANVPDSFLIEKVNENFAFITGASAPTPKAKAKQKQMDKAIPFAELSFIHFAIFANCFAEAKKRGILSAGEIAAGEQLLAML